MFNLFKLFKICQVLPVAIPIVSPFMPKLISLEGIMIIPMIQTMEIGFSIMAEVVVVVTVAASKISTILLDEMVVTED